MTGMHVTNRATGGVADRHRLALDRIAAAGPSGDARLPRSSGEQVAEFPPRVPRSDLTASTLERLLPAAGCVLVPGLLPVDTAAELAAGIDSTFDAYDRHGGATGTGDPWFDAFIPEPSYVHATRPWLRNGGGILTADSPTMIDRWFGLIASLGITRLVAEVFGEEPITSLDKCALRKINSGDGIEWHQDGSFLGIDSDALNMWVSLSDTTDSPGLDIVSRRFTEVAETGTGGAAYGWSTGPEVVAELAVTSPVVQPHFSAGDSLFFDALLLHRTTQPPPAHRKTRYAIETWFFRPSRFPHHQEVPIAF